MSYLYLKKELNISKEEILNLLYLDENFRVTDASRYEMINRIKENKEFDTLAINEKDSGLAKEYFKKNSKKKDFVPFMVNN